MKVLPINGSPHEHGCTDAALSLVADALRENGVEAEIYWLGVKPVTGCIGCCQCMKLGGSGLRPQERHHGGPGPDQPLLHHVRDARHPLALLVRRTRRQARGRVSGRGGRFRHAHAGEVYGLLPALPGGGTRGRNNSARAGEL